MTYEIESRTLTEQPTVAKRATVRIGEIGEWLQGAYAEVFGHLERIGAVPAGPPYARYTMREDSFDMEAGAPVGHVVPTDGGLVASALPGGLAARTVHRGPYDTLDEAFDALREWVREHGGEQAGPHWENYLNSPQEVPDPAGWITEVLMPYREAASAPAVG